MSAVADGAKLSVGDVVRYDVGESNGRARAINVEILE
jgi:cold shock CspA family protein